ncbi:MAG: hypothetical protein WDZ94_04885 [Patescibacteria group bacterium]
MSKPDEHAANGKHVPQQSTASRLAILDFKQYRWYEVILLLPVILVAIQGGLIGTGLGVLSLEFALKWMRNARSVWLGIVGALGISAVFLAVYGALVYVVLEWARSTLANV